MTTKKALTAEQQHDLHQKIWDLRNKMAEKLEELEAIHHKPFPTVIDASAALYTVYNTWNSDSYDSLETTVKKIRGH